MTIHVSSGSILSNAGDAAGFAAQLDRARDRLDESARLMTWALDLHDLINRFDVALLLDTAEVRRQISALKRGVELAKKARGTP